MSGDPLKKVQSGQRLTIPAAAYNEFVDAARANRSIQYRQGQTGKGEQLPRDIVLVQNTTEDDLDRFAVLAVNTPLILPGDNESSFLNQMAFKGIKPWSTHSWGFVILMEPIRAGAIGRACISGVCPVKVNFESGVSGNYAEPWGQSTSSLKCRRVGPAQILWTARPSAASGEHWCLVLLGRYLWPTRYITYKLWATAGSTTWTVPDTVTVIRLTLVGGGGGGGGTPADGQELSENFTCSDSSTVTIPVLVGVPGGGGGSAGMLVRRTIPVTPEDIFNVVVGAGGTAGDSSNHGGSGGDSSFHKTGYPDLYVTAKGGGGGTKSSTGGPGQGGIVDVQNWVESIANYDATSDGVNLHESLVIGGCPGAPGTQSRTGIGSGSGRVNGMGGQGGKLPLNTLKIELGNPYIHRGWGGNGADGGDVDGEAGQSGYVLVEY